jgi:hypothetical protein
MASNHNLGYASQIDTSAAAAAAVAKAVAAANLTYQQAYALAQGQSYPTNQTTLTAAAKTRDAALDPGAIINY